MISTVNQALTFDPFDHEDDSANDVIRILQEEVRKTRGKQGIINVYAGAFGFQPADTPHNAEVQVYSEKARIRQQPPDPPGETELLLRRLLWLRHGCPMPALYGDDGEMQCGKCIIDFKRAWASDIQDRFTLLGKAYKTEVQKFDNPQDLDSSCEDFPG